MDTAIDIYTKLVIALLSFTTPIIIQMLSVFSEGIEMTRARNAEQKRQIQKLLATHLNESQVDDKVVNKHQRDLKKINRSNNWNIFLLSPKWQSLTIFGSLLLSLCCIVVFWICKENKEDFLAHWFIWISFGMFIGTMFFIRFVAWAIIDTKQMLAKNKRDNINAKKSTPTRSNTNPTVAD